MSSIRPYSTFVALIFLISMGATGCRVPHPGFGDNPVSTESTETNNANPNLTTQAEPSTPDTVSTTSVDHGDTVTTSSPLSSTSQTSNATSSTTPLHPDEIAAREYCQRGSVVCYPMLTTNLERFEDYGSSKLNMTARQLNTVEPNQANYPLARMLDGGPQGKYETQTNYTVPSNGVVGFDIWLRPIRPDSENWNAFRIKNYISLLRQSNGELRCGFQGASLSIYVDVDLNAEAGEIYHIACAFDGTKKHMWLNGVIKSETDNLPTQWPSATPLSFGWSTLLENPFDGHIGAIRVWEDIDALNTEIKRLFPSP